MTPAQKRRRHRLMVAMAAAGPTPGFGAGSPPPRLMHELALPWPCSEDHPWSQVVVYADGTARCRRCDSEKKARWREENPDKETAAQKARQQHYESDPAEADRRRAQARLAYRRRMEAKGGKLRAL